MSSIDNKAPKFMSSGLNLTHTLLTHVRDAVVHENDVQKELREFTATQPKSVMMIPPEQGTNLAFFVRLLQAKKVIEVGVFTGYSALSMALALPADGTLVACDVDPDTMNIAQRFWDKAGVSDRIEARLGPGEESLNALLGEGWSGQADLLFVDADKTGYATYYELGLQLLRPGGLMLFDNILWSGHVADPDHDDEDTNALRDLAFFAGKDPRVHCILLTDADGLLAVMKPFTDA